MPMDEDLKALEQKLSQLIASYSSLHEENVKIRQELAFALQERDKIKQNVALASARLETLMAQLPQADLRDIL